MASDANVRRYRIDIKRSALKALKRLDAAARRRIARAIDALAVEPRPPGSLKMAGFEDVWPIRVGDYRVLYQVLDDRLLVLVLAVGHRKDVYRFEK